MSKKKILLIIFIIVLIAIVCLCVRCVGNRDTADTDVTTAENTAQAVIPPEGFTLAGDWTDLVGKRAHMTITGDEGDNEYDVEITWAGSATELISWTFSGTYDTDMAMLYYQDCRKTDVTTDEDGNVIDESVMYEGGTGTIRYFDETLIWQDDKEDAGADCRFIKETISQSTEQ